MTAVKAKGAMRDYLWFALHPYILRAGHCTITRAIKSILSMQMNDDV